MKETNKTLSNANEKVTPNDTPQTILTEKQEEFRKNICLIFDREIRMIKHRGLRTHDLAKLTEEEIISIKDIFVHCIDKVKFLEDRNGNVVGWEMKNENQKCDEEENIV